MVFSLYLQIDAKQDENCYSYIGIAEESNIHIHIAADHIKLLTEDRSFYTPENYLPTSRSIQLDLAYIDNLIHDFIRQDDYELITWLEQKKSMTISYYQWPEGRLTQRHIFEEYCDEFAAGLINELYPIMEQVMNEVFQIDLL